MFKKKEKKEEKEKKVSVTTTIRRRLSTMTVRGMWASMLVGFVVLLVVGILVAALLFFRVSGEVVFISGENSAVVGDGVSREELQAVLDTIEESSRRHEALKESFTNPARNPIQYQSVSGEVSS